MTVSVQQVIEAQAHIGTLKNEAHPKTRKYRSDVFKGLVILNPEIIASQLENARNKVQKAKAEGKSVLIVCEKKMYQEELAIVAQASGVSYLNYKVPSGFITNFETLKKRIDSMNDMIRFMEGEEFSALTKKEQLTYKRKFARIQKIYGGVTGLASIPDLVIVIDGTMLDGFVSELAKKKNIDNIIVTSTDFDRYYPEDKMMVSNIGSYKSLDFVIKYILS